MSLEPRITILIRSISNVAGQSSAVILDGQAFALSISESPWIESISLRNTSPTAVEGNIRIPKIGEFPFVNFEQGKCQININQSNGADFIEALSSDITDYLNALMAPIATGEEMSKQEYLDLVASFYNRGISDEIAASRIRASIEFPSAITNVRGGTFSGRRAEFDIPLLDLLVLETPLIYEVTWR